MANSQSSRRKGAMAWMARNPVAANTLMLFFLIGGVFWGTKIKQEVFPEFEIDMVQVRVSYPGASPTEVEQGIILPVEEAISGLDGIAQVESTAVEGVGTVRVEALLDTDIQQLATDIKNEVDRINSFPEDAEEPVVTVPLRRRSVITLVLYGDLDPGVLRESAEMVRDQLLQDPEIVHAELDGARPMEISIDIGQQTLREYDLTIEEIAQKVRTGSLDLPGGTIKDSGGHVGLRLQERREIGEEFGSIPIVSTPGGSRILLRDIAAIDDGFEENDAFYTYNAQPAIGINVYRVGDQTPIGVSKAVNKHMERLRSVLPDKIGVDAVDDRSQIYKQRLQLLLKNGYLGLTLVFLLLGIFLEPRLAFWVTMGIPVSFLGSLIFLPIVDVSINMVSLFAFIVTLGIVVDDTIIIGENVYSLRQRGYGYLKASIEASREMAVPVTFAVLTNIITFMPLYFVPGVMGKIFRNIPLVVAIVFLISLVEALFVLPAHLGHQKRLKKGVFALLARWQESVSHGVSRLITRVFTPSLILALRYRYLSVAIGITVLLVTGAYIKTGRMGMTMFPRVESDNAYANFSLPVGTDVELARKIEQRLLRTAHKVTEENGGSELVQGMLSSVNQNSGWIKIYLTPPGVRPISTAAFVEQWRKASGRIPGVDMLRFKSNFGGPGSGAGLTVELQHRDTGILEQAAGKLSEELDQFSVVSDIDDGFSKGKAQFDFQLLPAAYRLGLTPEAVARQIRTAYYGREVTRQLRGRNEVKIMVRLPENERHSLYSLETLMLRTPTGGEVPFTDVVRITPGHSYTEIGRRDGRRVITVSAEVDPPRAGVQVEEQLKTTIMPALVEQFSGLGYSFEGKQADRKESMAALGRGMGVAMLLVYTLLAVVFRSYFQPAIIMAAIPFGIVGAVFGHILMGYSLSLVSFFGVVALSGVVVNDSLVLIDLANRNRLQGHTGYAAVVNAAVSRFRPILLTTLTTFFGLLPMIFETSRQARFLIPMAISLGFGILFATLVTLVLIPSLYLILEDIKVLLGTVFGSNLPPEQNS